MAVHHLNTNKRPEKTEELNLPNEVWKDIPGYEELYQISNMGRARSKDRIRYQNHVSGKIVPHTYKGKIIALDYSMSATGCLNVYDCKKKETFSMHSLMCQLFGQKYADEFYFGEHISPQLPGEIWKDIPGYEGLYQASTFGRIKRLEDEYQIVLKYWDFNGYPAVRLSKDNKQQDYTIHRLVAMTFLPNPENKTQVNHIDGNKYNSRLENLEWVTPSENMQHAVKTGLLKYDYEKLNQYISLGRIKTQVPIKCIELNREFDSIMQASEILNISYSKLAYAVSKESKTHKADGYTFERMKKYA